MSVRLICIGSSSAGNAYALDSGTEILLLEAGCQLSVVKKSIDFRLKDVVGCCVTHVHGDHARYATEYARNGIHIYCNEDVAQKKQFPYGSFTALSGSPTEKIGSFRVVPFENHHDVPIFGYLIYHPDMGTLLFSTDSYRISQTITGVDHYLIEANYSDELLKRNVWEGRIDQRQADRVMLSHMSLDNCIRYLRDSFVGSGSATTKTITLCHLSDRNADPEQFRRIVQQAFGVPVSIARKGTVVTLSKEII